MTHPRRRPAQVRSQARPNTSKESTAASPQRFEAEVLPGLEPWAEQEITQCLGDAVRLLGRPGGGRIALEFGGSLQRLNDLRSVIAVHLVEDFEIPRPQALLGHQHFTRLVRAAQLITDASAPGAFSTLRISAAGSQSAVLRRLKEELGHALRLTSVEDDGDLLLSVRRRPDAQTGWRILLRLSHRPLSARAWRVCNLPGALNATVANVMARIATPSAKERFLNVACGSGTLLIERLALGAAKLAVGCDLSPSALDCARQNLQASGHQAVADLVQADAGSLPFGSGSFDTIVADLPYGMLMGSEAELRDLYPRFLVEATRVAAASCSLVVITPRRGLFETALAEHRAQWTAQPQFTVKVPFQSGMIEPSIFFLKRA
ncbi:MAG: methyltransferase domain-containing protein [Chloroflexi bacterium]|nr:methyltransferase domain-containing protein [Chloroflexota bacterium]